MFCSLTVGSPIGLHYWPCKGPFCGNEVTVASGRAIDLSLQNQTYPTLPRYGTDLIATTA